jgi:hypothetical protein
METKSTTVEENEYHIQFHENDPLGSNVINVK